MSDEPDSAASDDAGKDDSGSDSDEEFDADVEFERMFPAVPDEFHSVETGKPFEHCIECQLPLLDQLESPYLIAKAVQREETILEWAMCGDCSTRFREEISEESKQAVAKYFSKSKAPPEHIMSLPEVKTSYCYVCARRRDEIEGYSLQAVCSGHELISLLAPMLICHQCEEEAGESLSKATRDHFDRFYEDNFPGPPMNDVELPKRRPVVI